MLLAGSKHGQVSCALRRSELRLPFTLRRGPCLDRTRHRCPARADERGEALKLFWSRPGPKPLQSNLLPYVVEVVAADKPGILFQLADFFDRQGITIESLHCSRYRAMQTGADMFSAQVTIGVPATMHIAGLRDDFLAVCDPLKPAATLKPLT